MRRQSMRAKTGGERRGGKVELRCKTAECCVKASEMFRFSRGGGFFPARLDKCGFVVYDYITGRGASRRGRLSSYKGVGL